MFTARRAFMTRPSAVVSGPIPTGPTVYATTPSGLSISTDGGSTFTYTRTTANGLGHNYVMSCWAVGDTVYAATNSGFSISTNRGETFVNRTTADGLGNNFCAKVYVSGSTIYVATAGGLSVSTNGGTSFTNRTTSNGLAANNGRCVFYDPVLGRAYYGTQSGLSISYSGSTDSNFYTPSALSGYTIMGVYASGNTIYATTQSNGLFVSTNGGSSWVNRTSSNGLGTEGTSDVTAVGSTVYVATGYGLSTSTNSGTSFTNKLGMGNNYLYDVFVSGSNIFVGTGGTGLSYSTDGGTTFVNRTVANSGLVNDSVFEVFYIVR